INRNLRNVNDVWREYSIGLSGCPSIKNLEQEHRTLWRINRTESRFFSSGTIIYREVENIARSRIVTCDEAAGILESRLIELKESIDKLIRLL
ncbi:transcriptional activator of glycolytic enzymes-domain-containing protein, partial [Helicostylum pulchrum]